MAGDAVFNNIQVKEGKVHLEGEAIYYILGDTQLVTPD